MNLGTTSLKWAKEAHVKLAEISLHPEKMKGSRAILNRIEREGFTFEVIQPPFSAEQMTGLQKYF